MKNENIGIVNAKFNDKIIFSSKQKCKIHLLKILENLTGSWKVHPIFRDMQTKEIIEWMRGKDNDV